MTDPKTSPKPKIAHRFTLRVPQSNTTIEQWWEMQDDPSASVRALIRDEILNYGLTDTVNRPISQQPRRGRPPLDSDQLTEDADEADEQLPEAQEPGPALTSPTPAPAVAHSQEVPAPKAAAPAAPVVQKAAAPAPVVKPAAPAAAADPEPEDDAPASTQLPMESFFDHGNQ